MKIIEDVRFVVCPEKKKSSQVCDQDVAMAMLAKDRDVANMQNWLIFDDKEVGETFIACAFSLIFRATYGL